MSPRRTAAAARAAAPRTRTPLAPAPAQEEAPGAGVLGLDLTSLLPDRPVGDQLAGEVSVILGGRRYVLPVLPIYYNRKWKESIEINLQGMLVAIEEAGDDLSGIMAAFATATPTMIDALYAYDRAGEEEPEGPVHPPVLPDRDTLERRATETEVMMATLEVWSAANPFVALAHSAMRREAQAPTPIIGPPPSDSLTPTNTARASTGGRRAKSSAS